jgi:hypothetical protein
MQAYTCNVLKLMLQQRAMLSSSPQDQSSLFNFIKIINRIAQASATPPNYDNDGHRQGMSCYILPQQARVKRMTAEYFETLCVLKRIVGECRVYFAHATEEKEEEVIVVRVGGGGLEEAEAKVVPATLPTRLALSYKKLSVS